MRYGEPPTQLGSFEVNCKEMMFYQYLPIKLIGEIQPTYENRLKCFDDLIGSICCDFIGVFGLDKYRESYIYLTAKFMYQMPNCSFNRTGYHSDGFMTDDINYIWSDKNPTIFNTTDFELSQDDKKSLIEMEWQEDKRKQIQFDNNVLLRLNQFNIHKVNESGYQGMRTFLKVSFSKDKYDLIGNSHNYLLDYDWDMKERQSERNIPQTTIKYYEKRKPKRSRKKSNT